MLCLEAHAYVYKRKPKRELILCSFCASHLNYMLAQLPQCLFSSPPDVEQRKYIQYKTNQITVIVGPHAPTVECVKYLRKINAPEMVINSSLP